MKGIPWWSDFWEKLVIEDLQGYLFNQLFFNREGFIIMAENSEEDKQHLIFIKVFQQAMKGTFAKMYAKVEAGKDPPIKKKVERLRAELNYCYDDLSFKEYLSDFSVRGGLNKYFNQHQEEISLLIKKTPWQELIIWSLLAIASYKPKDKPTIIDDSSLLNNQQLEEMYPFCPDSLVFQRTTHFASYISYCFEYCDPQSKAAKFTQEFIDEVECGQIDPSTLWIGGAIVKDLQQLDNFDNSPFKKAHIYRNRNELIEALKTVIKRDLGLEKSK
ncbi:CRISPR-associated protein Cas8a1/Csx13 [Aphanizomenon flos-aquae FACHB-1040]|uniref:CRISPR-associated protein Cas8a1/Csx13 n=1 Tax=Aphanizomenon flos-aquae FACHB-1040 TaxID=2692887 RepID=A0ABR8BRU7_APHFL|nr:CRISPR-associated protein Cas8a1/Csx13 [Aphanizomenon flos-aquae FACHB-1040]